MVGRLLDGRMRSLWLPTAVSLSASSFGYPWECVGFLGIQVLFKKNKSLGLGAWVNLSGTLSDCWTKCAAHPPSLERFGKCGVRQEELGTSPIAKPVADYPMSDEQLLLTLQACVGTVQTRKKCLECRVFTVLCSDLLLLTCVSLGQTAKIRALGLAFSAPYFYTFNAPLSGNEQAFICSK